MNVYMRGLAGSSAGIVKSPMTEALWKLREEQSDITDTESIGTSDPTHLITKKPSESAVTIEYPFSTDEELRFRYSNAFGFIRMGIILEDLDAMAGSIAFMHADDANPATRPLVLVTASVDKIELSRPILMDEDAEMHGQVTWTGASSMEILVAMRRKVDGEELLRALFIFVARERVSGKAAKINMLQPCTDGEQALFYEAAERAAQRKAQRRALVQGQNNETRHDRERMVHTMVQAARPFVTLPALAPPGTVLMRDTLLTNTLVTQPQHQNTAGRVFGGFLMRRGFELAFSCAYVFSGRRPHFYCVDEVEFNRPVEIGNLLQFESKVSVT